MEEPMKAIASYDYVGIWVQLIAKLSVNLNIVESWDGFIYDFSNHSTPTHPPTDQKK